MLKLVISNQRGGVSKTTTTVTLARYLADRGKRVLVVDTDPQGSIAVILGLKPGDRDLHSFIIKRLALEDCVTQAGDRIDIICGNRDTAKAEQILMGETARELAFLSLFPPVEQNYDAILFDVAPSISLLQTCAIMYCQQIFVPVAMDPLSMQGAAASLQTSQMLGDLYNRHIRNVAIVPVMVDRRMQMTSLIMKAVEDLANRAKVPILSHIRVDSAVNKASRTKQYLQDYDPKGRALQDYIAAFDQFMGILEGQEHASDRQKTA